MAHLTPKTLAEREGVPLATVYRWNSEGTGPALMKIGKYVRYREDDVLRWEQAQVRSPRPVA